MVNNIERTLVSIITEAVLEQELAQAIESLGAIGYTVFDVRGKGRNGRRSADWRETANIQFNIVCQEKVAEKIVEYITEHYLENFGMTIYFHNVNVLRSEKF